MQSQKTKVPITLTEMVRRLRFLAGEAHTSREIGKQLGIPHQRVWRLAKRHKIELAGPRGYRRLSTALSPADVDVIATIATGAQISRQELATRILKIACEDGGKAALRMLGDQARPKRPWSRRARSAAA